jgi:hypothetical protein
MDRRAVTRGGTTYAQNTANIDKQLYKVEMHPFSGLPSAEVFQEVFRNFEGDEYEKCVATTEALPAMRTTGRVTIESPM